MIARVFLAAALVWLLGCNVVQLRQQGLVREFARAGMASRSVKVGDDTIHYWRSGSALSQPRRVPVLLLHGFGGAAVWQWSEQLPALVPDRAVLVPDLLWFGGSSSNDPDPSLDHQVAAIVSLLDHEGLAEVDVVGISYGGLVGFLLAREHGARVRRLVLVDSPGPAYRADDLRELLARFEVASVDELIVPRDTDAVARLLEIAYHHPPRAPRFALRQTQRELYDPYRGAQVALVQALIVDLERYGVDERVDAELGLIWGEGDSVFPLAIGRRLASAWQVPLHVITNARHAPNLEHPEQFNEAMLDLLDADR